MFFKALFEHFVHVIRSTVRSNVIVDQSQIQKSLYLLFVDFKYKIETIYKISTF